MIFFAVGIRECRAFYLSLSEIIHNFDELETTFVCKAMGV